MNRRNVLTMKKLIILVGLPGSGKSFLAKELRLQYFETHKGILANCVVCSADNFFMKHNVYTFDADMLGLAHSYCRSLVAKAMYDETELIIVDNTNLTKAEREPYESLALSFNYQVEMVEPNTTWRYDVQECYKRNKHGVPYDRIEKMFFRLENDKAIYE